MSDAQEEKPKITIEVIFQGNTAKFVVKPTVKLSKVFEAAAKQFNISEPTVRWVFEGSRLRREQTAAEVGITDGDVIDAEVGQQGGWYYRGDWTSS